MKLNSKRRLYFIKEIKEMLLWPFLLYFRTHFIHNHPHFLQRLCMQALHMLNSDNLERSLLKINPTQDFLSFPLIESSCRLAPHKAHEQLPPSWNAEQNSQYWEQSWVERCIICIRYIYFYPPLAPAFKELKCPNLFNKTSFAQNGWDLLEGYFPISWMLSFVSLKP